MDDMTDSMINETTPYDTDRSMSEAGPPESLSVIDDWEQLVERDLAPIDEEIADLQIFHWNIPSFDSLPDRALGPVFEAGGYKWSVLVFPRGNSNQDVMSVYLEFSEAKINPSEDVHACAQFAIYVSSPSDPTYYVGHAGHHRFTTQETDWGFTRFVDLHQLFQFDPSTNRKPLIEDDGLRISAYVRVIKDTTGVLWHNFINYDSKKVTGYVGLKNQGATCYMNSLFQSLYCTNYFRKAVYQIPTEDDDPNNSIPLSLQRLFYNLQFSDSPVGTTELTRSFGWTSMDAFMQHDVQEFNRVLQDNLEEKMKGTPADGAIKELFLGKMKSYIKCINVEYESSRSEDYYDIQLNVKGFKNIEESFKDYIAEEVLEGDNKYMAENYGLQDAKKGVIFESFPPVLHLQLKRFEYDIMQDTMVKVNDRYEFPLEIDLEPYLSENADKSQSHKYILHGVLVHSGDLNGHYFAFVKPTKQDKWFKFDDDRVVPVALKEVLEDNFGGEPLSTVGSNAKPAMRAYKRFTNAYMLVYIRETMQDKILGEVRKEDIPAHLVQRIEEERLTRERRQREREEQHLYMRVFVATDKTFQANRGFDFTSFDERLSPQDIQLHVLRARKDQKYGEFLQELGELLDLKPEAFRLWLFVNRQNQTVRVDTPIPEGNEDLTLEQIKQKFLSTNQTLRLYLDVARDQADPLFPEPPPHATTCLVFIKLFDPQTQEMRGLGSIFVPKEGKIGTIVDELNAMAGFSPGTPLQLYEEIKPSMIDPMNLMSTFTQAEIQDGDIICIQYQLSEEEETALRAQGLYTTVPDFLDYQHNKRHVLFVPKHGDPAGQVEMALHKNSTYSDMTTKLGAKVNADPEKIQLFLPRHQDGPPVAVPYSPTRTLDSMMRGGTMNALLRAKLFYDVLDIRLDEMETKRLIKIIICTPNLKSTKPPIEVWISKQARISELVQELGAQGATFETVSGTRDVRVFEAADSRYYRDLFHSDHLSKVSDRPNVQLYAEEIPEEELDAQADDFFITVFHYQRDISRAHSVPFKFLVKKDESFSETKKRLQARVGLTDAEWSKVKFSIVSGNAVSPIDKDDFVLSEYPFKLEDSLGLDYIDRSGRANRFGAEKPLSIRG